MSHFSSAPGSTTTSAVDRIAPCTAESSAGAAADPSAPPSTASTSAPLRAARQGPNTPGFAEPAAAGAVATPRARTSGYQRIWLTIYWLATTLSFCFVVMAAVEPPFDAELVVLTGFGALATLLGALMAARLARRSIADERFDAATAGMRTLSIAWLVFLMVLVVLTITQTRFGETGEVDTSIAVNVTGTLVSTIFGAAALLLVVGSGYTDYRNEMAATRARTSVQR